MIAKTKNPKPKALSCQWCERKVQPWRSPDGEWVSMVIHEECIWLKQCAEDAAERDRT